MIRTHHHFFWPSLALLLILIFIYRFSQVSHEGIPHVGYVAEMAMSPYYGSYPPFSNRLLLPLVLHIAGYIPKPGEIWLPLLGSVFMGLTFALLLRIMGFKTEQILIALAIFAGSAGMIDILREFGVHNVDATSHIFILLALCGMILKNDSLVSLASILGVLNREWALAILPGWYLYHFGFRINSESMLRLLRVSLPALLIYLFISTLYYPNTATGVIIRNLQGLLPQARLSGLHFYAAEIDRLGYDHFFRSVISLNFYTFALIALWPFAILGFLRAPLAWRRFCIYYLIVTSLQFIIASDVWRLSFYLFPVVLSLFLYGLESIRSLYGEKGAILTGVIVTILFILFQSHPGLLIFNTLLCIVLRSSSRFLNKHP